ncbi:glycosyltransferase family 4 protein [Methylocystis iwaonis]|uniref:Glycosyl transferase n=1 Tax=Methylocystis iwaonis TaxID=2885079 RepID=A0ABM8E7E4_9HYPH|nr:glycosyltransferase family 4 protein [Methylocystis iwaonis]BDV33873.1 glycosyl transferase [Methylocystis iwaonis]
MQQSAEHSAAPLRIVHVFRAPVGGLFRHVLDLTRAQIARGHAVGLIADSTTGGAAAEKQFAELLPKLSLGVMRLPIHRLPHPSDLGAAIAINKRIAALKPDVVHGHGSKGGVYARANGLFSGDNSPVRIYTPHGGSLNYEPGSLSHRIFMAMEALLATRTDALLFESAFIASRFEAFVGKPKGLARIIPNGVSEDEFAPVQPRADAVDLLYVGELRDAKGIDTLIDAMVLLGRRGLTPRLLLIGGGPNRAALERQAQEAGLADRIVFGSPRPAREAFALGRAMVVPSRFESLPYIVLEAAAAGVPLVATNVGGVPEIFGPYADRLIQPDNPEILADALARLLSQPAETLHEEARALSTYVASRFSVSRMVDDVLQGYRDAIAARAADR